jgi:NAD(P)-dependent dehydrogenase (short-subunit alcohol dehydrogenase family)
MAEDLGGRRAIITGSSKGIGYSIAEAMVAAGMDVVISARDKQEVGQAAARLSGSGGGKATGIACDVRKISDVRELIGQGADALGGIDILVNNAGVGTFSPVGEMPVEKWDQIIETNLNGVFYCCHEALPHLRKSDAGWIINIASLAGKNAFPGGAAYNASKFGLVGFSEALMQDVRHEGIRVNYIMPGSVNTYFGDKAPSAENDWMIQPEDIGQLVMDLLRFPSNALPSRIEVRPSQPPKK